MILERGRGNYNIAEQTADVSQRKAAIVAGAGLLLMIVPSIFATFVVINSLIVPGDAAATANNIAADALRFRLAILSILLVIVLDVVVAWALTIYFKPVNKGLSLLAGWFRLVYAAIFTVAAVNLVTALRLVTDGGLETLFETDQRQSLAMLSLNAFNEAWEIGLLLFGVHLVLIGYLAFKSGTMPRILGILVIIAGLGYMIDSVAGLMLPDLEVTIGQFTFIGELLLAIWLLVSGLRSEKRQARGPEAADVLPWAE